ncbi:hypothetical protein PV371_33390 [Streptomyces sp. TX20-6-3]|uniref:hypothetical protein n=1 Tax=Streptomyces sp. TX20-6-3 TaxID=3028705 RepID=UPI0029A72A6A|nr:hypothetical protein [Streptomyces sp. TX20-6-3]MDX2564521.1 hypothetical protein [Streptomyces sp. TX20-6-3]
MRTRTPSVRGRRVGALDSPADEHGEWDHDDEVDRTDHRRRRTGECQEDKPSDDESHGEDQEEQAHVRFNDWSSSGNTSASDDFFTGVPQAAELLQPRLHYQRGSPPEFLSASFQASPKPHE